MKVILVIHAKSNQELTKSRWKTCGLFWGSFHPCNRIMRFSIVFLAKSIWNAEAPVPAVYQNFASSVIYLWLHQPTSYHYSLPRTSCPLSYHHFRSFYYDCLSSELFCNSSAHAFHVFAKCHYLHKKEHISDVIINQSLDFDFGKLMVFFHYMP